MSYNYSNFYDLAVRQISDKGRNITHLSVDEGTYNSTTGTVYGNTQTETIVKALEVRPKYNQYTKLQTNITERYEKEYMIAASIPLPREKDRIIDGDNEYQVVKVEEVKPGDTAIYYRVRVRK
jgi:hypothetical protein